VIGAMLAEALPGVPFTLSHQLVPILREYFANAIYNAVGVRVRHMPVTPEAVLAD
jgi:hypothetical protein